MCVPKQRYAKKGTSMEDEVPKQKIKATAAKTENLLDKAMEAATVCPICTNVIADATKTLEREDALFCDGVCQK